METKEFMNNLLNKLLPLVNQKIIISDEKELFDQSVYKDKIIIVLEGEYKLTHILPNSKEFTIGYYKAPNILLPNNKNNDNFMALFTMKIKSKCTIGLIPYDEKSLSEDIWCDFYNYSDLISQKIYIKMRDLLFNTKQNALFSILIRFSNSYGVKVNDGIKINIKLSNIDLAEYIGTTPETISRILRVIKENRLIKYEDKYIIITNIEYMKNQLDCKYCENRLCEI